MDGVEGTLERQSDDGTLRKTNRGTAPRSGDRTSSLTTPPGSTAPMACLQPSASVIGVPFTATTTSGTASLTINVPNDTALSGVNLYHQWAIVDNVNALGLVVTGAAHAIVGL